MGRTFRLVLIIPHGLPPHRGGGFGEGVCNRFGDEVVADGDQGEEPEEESAGLIIEVIGEEGDEKDAQGVSLAQTVIDESECQEQEQKDARREYHRGFWLIEQLFYKA